MLNRLTLVCSRRSVRVLAFGAAVFGSITGTAAESSLQDLSAALQSLPQIVIYEAKEVVTLDDDRKASMVSNLMIVLCAESEVQPVINTGTLYG